MMAAQSMLSFDLVWLAWAACWPGHEKPYREKRWVPAGLPIKFSGPDGWNAPSLSTGRCNPCGSPTKIVGGTFDAGRLMFCHRFGGNAPGVGGLRRAAANLRPLARSERVRSQRS